MIVAGIDEAGLGPWLGPLTTGSSAFAVPDTWQPDTLWHRLADAVGDRYSRGEHRPVVADSKEVHRSGGVPALEFTVASFAWLLSSIDAPVCHAHRIAEADQSKPTHPCYSLRLDPFPAVVDPETLRGPVRSLASALEREGAKLLWLETAALYEPPFNRRLRSGLNKNATVMMETGSHLARLVERYPDQPMHVVIDKQGGRNDYLPFLSELFPGSWIDTLAVGADVSQYRVRRKFGDVSIVYQAKADRLCFPTALASMAAKYVRERAMDEFNRWFCQRLPALKPTAGYPGDAGRWLEEVKKTRRRKELMLDLVIRKK